MPRAPSRGWALAGVFLVLFVVALALQAAIMWPIIAVEEGPSEALQIFGRSWGRLDPTDESNGGVAFEQAGDDGEGRVRVVAELVQVIG